MRRILIFTIAIIGLVSMAQAQSEKMYIMKNGKIAGQYNVLTEIDSIIFYEPDIDPPTGFFVDERDGNEYSYLTIGEQVWMGENLKYLPEVMGPESNSSSTPMYYVYDYVGTNVEEAKATENYAVYGVIYNWPAAMAGQESSGTNPSGVQGVCPTGWHMPSDSEWDELADFLGGSQIAGGKMKSTGTIEDGTGLWYEPNAQATNESGFTALPGGYRYHIENIFGGKGYSGNWWTCTLSGSANAWWRNLAYSEFDLYKDFYLLEEGFSVRCVKD